MFWDSWFRVKCECFLLCFMIAERFAAFGFRNLCSYGTQSSAGPTIWWRMSDWLHWVSNFGRDNGSHDDSNNNGMMLVVMVMMMMRKKMFLVPHLHIVRELKALYDNASNTQTETDMCMHAPPPNHHHHHHPSDMYAPLPPPHTESQLDMHAPLPLPPKTYAHTHTHTHAHAHTHHTPHN